MEKAHDTVMNKQSKVTYPDKDEVKGYDFNKGIDYSAIFQTYRTMGIQSTNMHKAMELINKMLHYKGPEGQKCKIYLGYTSNMISSGNRELIRYLCQHRLVDVICTTAGGIEEDFIKCLAKSYVGSFKVDDRELRRKGINRIGNMVVPNDNYCLFEDWINPLLKEMKDKQDAENINWTPSKMIDFLGSKIDNKESVYYWCHKNNIPVFCPAITDGSLGDVLFFNSYRNPGLRLDLVEDIRLINKSALNQAQTGCLILGGGVIKHHIMNANLMRNGTNMAVYINTAIEYDCSDSGATCGEAYSWGKIAIDGESVKVYSEVSLIFPVIMAETFVKYNEARMKEKKEEKAEE